MTIRIGVPYSGRIASPGEVQAFALDLQAGTPVLIDVLGSAGDGALAGLSLADPSLRLLGPNGSLVLSDDNSGLGSNARIWFVPAETGRYQLEVSAPQSSGAGSYKVIAQVSPDSGALSVGTPQFGAVEYVGDLDLYRVSLVKDQTYLIDLLGETLSDPYLELLDGSGATISADDDSGVQGDSYLSFTPSVSGDFWILARESGNNATGGYALSLVADVPEGLATRAAVAVNSTTDGRIDWVGDRDWFAVSLHSGTTYQFDLTGSAQDGAAQGLNLEDPWLGLFDRNGQLLASNDDSGSGTNARLAFTPTESGLYYLSAEEAADAAAGRYRLIVNASPVAGDLSEGKRASGAVDFLGDIDQYRYTVRAGEVIRFDVDRDGLWLEVLNRSGETLVEGSSSLLYSSTGDDQVLVQVRALGNNSTGAYTISAVRTATVTVESPVALETDGTLTYKFSLSEPLGVSVSFFVETSILGTARGGIDFVESTATIEFSAGQTEAFWSVPLIDDLNAEPTRSIVLTLSNPKGLSLADSVAVGFVRDNESLAKLPLDPFAQYQWHLFPSPGANLLEVWPQATGKGVTVAVFDQGVDSAHEDLRSVSIAAGWLSEPQLTQDNHGTAVAGLIGAAHNGAWVAGVAPRVTLLSIYSPLNGEFEDEIALAYRLALAADVLNDSWGFAPQVPTAEDWAFYDNFKTERFAHAAQALESLASEGREGLGTIVVQSAGNSYALGDDTNLHNFQNSRYIITVAATDFDGQVASYSSPGASILLSAPGGGTGDILRSMITTDRVGSLGYEDGEVAFLTGTSFSAPIVSGVVALMLEANPKLGWRDIQTLLAYTAAETAKDSNAWTSNGAKNWNGGGLHFDALTHDLGFGLVDAYAAVRLAESWSSSPKTSANLQVLSVTTAVPTSIPEGEAGLTQLVRVDQEISVERAEVSIQITHPFLGDLALLLISPSGTASWLLYRPGQGPLSGFGTPQDNIDFTFTTVLPMGESSSGTWSLSVFDLESGDIGTLQSWTLSLVGAPSNEDDVYVYTGELAAMGALDPDRLFLRDENGYDELNASVVSSRTELDLRPGAQSEIAGVRVQIDQSTWIESAVTGDGDDRLTGNASDNLLRGMRGDDLFYASPGKDELAGGDGFDRVRYVSSARELTLSYDDGRWQVSKGQPDGLGVDTLAGIEKIEMANRSIYIEQQPHQSFADLPIGLLQFFIVAFDAAPGVTYMNQLTEAYQHWMSIGDQTSEQVVKRVVEVFTTKSVFTDAYSNALSNVERAERLVQTVVKDALTPEVESKTTLDLVSAFESGMDMADVIFEVFGNLAKMPVDDQSYGAVSRLFANEVALAWEYTEVMNQSTTDLVTLRSVLSQVGPDSDTSTEEKRVRLILDGMMDSDETPIQYATLAAPSDPDPTGEANHSLEPYRWVDPTPIW